MRLTSATTALILALSAAAAPSTVPAVAVAACVKPPAVAHRGGTEKYPENTREAFRWATDTAKASWWETDIRFDAADVPFIVHDPTLDRTTNRTGAVADIDLSQARADGLRIDGGYLLPSLYELLKEASARPGVRVQLELKTVPTAAQLTKLWARLDWANVRDRVVILSFDPATLDTVNATPGAPPTVLLAELGDQDPTDVLPHATVYSKHHWAVTYARLTRWRDAGLTVYTWTVDDPATWQRMAGYGPAGIAGVVTNKPNAYRLADVC